MDRMASLGEKDRKRHRSIIPFLGRPADGKALRETVIRCAAVSIAITISA
jgi:hypothetical protein